MASRLTTNASKEIRMTKQQFIEITRELDGKIVENRARLKTATGEEKRLLIWQNRDMTKQLDKICAMWPRTMWPQNKRNAIY